MTLFSQKRSYDTAFAPKINPDEAQDYEKDFSESFLDNWHFQTYTGNSYSRTDNLHDEFEKDIAEIEQKTGQKLKNPYNSAFEEFFIEDVALGLVDAAVRNPFNPKSSRFHPENVAKREQERLDKYYKKVNELKIKYPELKARDLETIKQDIKEQAMKLYQKVNDGRDSSWLGDFLGSAAGSVIDPINLAATLVSGGGNTGKETIAKALGKTALGEFIVNSGIEAVIQPSVYQYKKELDIPYSKTEAALNVVAAGTGGAILGTATKALNLTGKELLGRYKKAVAKGEKFDGPTKEAAALLENQVEFDDWADVTSPYGSDFEGAVLHKKQVLAEMQRLTQEENALSKGYDLVSENPTGNAMEVLAEIKPEDMEKIWVNRGGYAGNNGVTGSGFGMVKFIFKHGKDEIPVEKADVVGFPRIVREYLPVIDDSHGGNRTWSVKRSDGRQVIYADRVFNEDGERHLVTIHVMNRKDNRMYGLFSEEKSRREAKPAHTMDTTQKTFSRTDESSAETSAPKSRFQGGGDPMADNITPEAPKVNDYDNLTLESLEKDIDADTSLSVEDKALAREEIEKMRREESWDNEIIDCILEFKQK